MAFGRVQKITNGRIAGQIEYPLADSGYQRPKFPRALAKVLPHLDVEIVKRSHQITGFIDLPKRWIERTIA